MIRIMFDQGRNDYSSNVLYRIVGGVMILGVLLLMGCEPGIDTRSQLLFDKALEDYEAGRYSPAREGLTRFLSRNDSGIQAAQAHYLRGLCHRRLGHDASSDAAAIDDFSQAVRLQPNNDLRQRCYLALGHTYFEQNCQNGYRKALDYYEKTVKLSWSASLPKALIYYRMGISAQCVGQWTLADTYFNRCIASESSSYKEDAEKRLGARMFRIQAGAFSELDGAMRRVSTLKRAGWQADWEAVRRKSGHFYLVRAGSFNTINDAMNALARFQSIQSDAFIVTASVNQVSLAPGACGEDVMYCTKN